MAEHRRQKNNAAEERDPFPLELVLSSLSLLVSLVGTSISIIDHQKQNRENQEQDEITAALESLLDQALGLHASLDAAIVLVGRNNRGLADSKPRFRSDGLTLDRLEFVKFARIETEITGLLAKTRGLSVRVRRFAAVVSSEDRAQALQEHFVQNVDDLLDNFSELTFAEIAHKLREALHGLEKQLSTAITRQHGLGSRQPMRDTSSDDA